jgi:hypothetical protein
VEEGVTRREESIPLSYAGPAARPERDESDLQLRRTWSLLLVFGVVLFVGGLVALIAGGARQQGIYLLVVGVAALGTVVAVRRRRRRR